MKPPQPRSNSIAGRAIAHLRKHGATRSKAIANAVGCDPGWVTALLKPYVESGVLVTCKVQVPGSVPQTEYRLAAGGRMPDEASIAQAEKEAGIPLAVDDVELSSIVDDVQAPAPVRAPKVKSFADELVAISVAQGAPIIKRGPTVPKFRVGLFSDGELRIELDGDVVTLNRQQTDQLYRLLTRPRAAFADAAR